MFKQIFLFFLLSVMLTVLFIAMAVAIATSSSILNPKEAFTQAFDEVFDEVNVNIADLDKLDLNLAKAKKHGLKRNVRKDPQREYLVQRVFHGRNGDRKRNRKPFLKKREAQVECTSCWCIPSPSLNGPCPDKGNRDSYEAEDYSSEHPFVTKFKSYGLPSLPGDSLPTLVTASGDGSCLPYAELQQFPPLRGYPVCPTPTVMKPAVCAFHYSDTCESGREDYALKTYPSAEAAQANGDIVTHKGACGVCSSAQDLAVAMNPESITAGTQCLSYGFNVHKIHNCFKNIVGLSPSCAWLFALDLIFVKVVCATDCRSSSHIANNPTTCELNDCHKCYESQSGPTFGLFAGRTRLNSGIITPDIKRKCGVIPDIGQDPCA